jgi:hypothetical protein
MGRAATVAAGSGRPLAKLEMIYFNHVGVIVDYPGIPRLMFSEELHLGDRRLAEVIGMRIGGYIETLTGIVAAGIEEGDFKSGLAPRETALTMLGMIQFAALRWSISAGAFDIKTEATGLWDNFKRIIR